MPLFQRIESRLGLTRADVTVALFLAGAALVGFVYTEFFEREADIERRASMLKLIGRYDSVRNAREGLGPAGMFRSPGDSDSAVGSWQPLTEEEVVEERMSERTSGNSRRKKLTLEEVAPIDINSAPAKVLELLPGVGEKIAERIVAYREQHPFERVEDIENVKGIGPKTFETMKGYLRVGGPGSGRVEQDDGVESTEESDGDTGYRR